MSDGVDVNIVIVVSMCCDDIVFVILCIFCVFVVVCVCFEMYFLFDCVDFELFDLLLFVCVMLCGVIYDV